jgi:rsbT co-antagonist protein RsbR
MNTHSASVLPGRIQQAYSIEARPQGLFLGGSRALVHSHVATEMLRQQLFRQVGDDLARAILAQAGRHGGWNDAQLLLQEQPFDSLESMVAAQYDLLCSSGYGNFEIYDLVMARSKGEAYIRVVCTDSPEAESHRRLFGRAAAPACCHLVGYSSGWASAMSGMPLLTIETRCVARGDERCEFETLPYEDFVGPDAAFWKSAFESTSQSLALELKAKLATIEKQSATIEQQRMAIIEQQRVTLAALAAPILRIAEGMIALPIIGAVDEERALLITERLLNAIVAQRARGVIVDVTGVETLDSGTASYLCRMAQAAQLLGVRVVISGISPNVAQVLLGQDVRLIEVLTCRTLQDGISLLQRQTTRRRDQVSSR